MHTTVKMLTAALTTLTFMIWAVGCGATGSAGAADHHAPPERAESTQSQPVPIAESAGSDDQVVYASRSAPRAAPAESEAQSEADASRREDSPDGEQSDSPRQQQLIYTGALVLAIYDVEDTQRQAISVVEEMGGYVSERSSTQLTARVPADKFRTALDDLAELGDVLDKSWRAQDVTEKMRDLDIRLRNALTLRDRLEALLEKVETIEEALKIEAELERITLEVERIRGTLQNMENRIAYSTIEISFDTIEIADVPDDDFLLPFRWLHTLGLESLLRAPEMHR